MSNDFETNLTGASDVLAGYHRLVEQGLAVDANDERGINDAGIQTLGDLLAVLRFQAGTGSSSAEQVCSASARAMLSALSDLVTFIRDEPIDGTDTLQPLTAAVREAREG